MITRRTQRSSPWLASLATAVLACVACGVCGCGSSLPSPPTSPQPKAAFSEVLYPPPPAHVETIPPKPTARSVWIDGSWLWQGRRWVWQPGGWVEVPPGATYARWESHREDDGKLVFAPSKWRDAKGADIESPTILAPSHTSASTSTPAAGLKPEETQGTGAFDTKSSGDNGGSKK